MLKSNIPSQDMTLPPALLKKKEKEPSAKFPHPFSLCQNCYIQISYFNKVVCRLFYIFCTDLQVFTQLSFPLSYLKSMCFPFQSWPASPRAFFNNWALLSFLPLSSIYHFTLCSSLLINRSLNQKLWLSEVLFYLKVDRLASHSFIDIYQKKAEDP